MRRSLLLISLLIIIVWTCGCSIIDQNEVPSGKYVVVYEEIDEWGTIVSGQYPYPPYPGGPMGYTKPFLYKKSDYAVGQFPYHMNDSIKILLGVYNVKGSANVNIVSGLDVVEIYDLPYTHVSGLTIMSMDKNGTVKISYDNESIDLAPGTSWTAPIMPSWNETDTVKYPPPDIYTGIDNGTNYTYTLRFERKVTIQNKGIYDK